MIKSSTHEEMGMVTVDGGILLQSTDRQDLPELKCVTRGINQRCRCLSIGLR